MNKSMKHEHSSY